MLLKMLPEQVSNYWPHIRNSIEQALPPVVGESPNKMGNILEQLLTGEMQCWVAFRKDVENEVVGFIITTVISDPCSKTRNLLIYSLCGLKLSRGLDWIEGMEALRKFAKLMKCSRIVAYSDNQLILKVVEKLGGDTRYKFITFEL
jgi:hypothetical protein